jgi:hypothetical protein
MKSRLWATLALVFAVAATLFIARRNARRITEQAESVRALEAERVSLDAQNGRLALTVEQRGQESASAENKPSPPAGVKPEASPPLIPATSTPEQTHLRTLSSWLKLRNRALYARLNLTPEQMANFERMETEHWLRVQDILASSRAQGVPTTDAAFIALNREEQARFDREQLELLGPAADRELREYLRLAPARAMANALAGNAIYTDPLTKEQGERMTQILADNSASYRKGGRAQNQDIDTGQTLAQLQGVLSPAQFALFKKTFTAQLALNAIGPLITEATKKTAAAPPPAPAGKQ